MAVITIFGGPFCRDEEVARLAADSLGYRLVEEDLFALAAERHDASPKSLKRAVYGPPSLFWRLSHERERCVAYLREALAETLTRNKLVYCGWLGHLLPQQLTHVLKVCMVDNFDYRVELAIAEQKLSEKDAQRLIRKGDQERLQWTQYLFDKEPYDKSLYDIVIPLHQRPVEDVVKLIQENTLKEALETTPASTKAMDDFLLAAKVSVALAEKGHHLQVSCDGGKAVMVVDKFVMRLKHLEEEVREIAEAAPGVTASEVRKGPNFHSTSIYCKTDFELPAKVLLVDDEKEFVQTLSERLETRSIGSAVVYDGEEALSFLKSDEPEVMVLDLRMPGIDGMEVLRQVKQKHPGIEVIILTGHGSAQEKVTAEELGAFAYLEKPTDIDVLAQTMKQAYRKLKMKRAIDSE
jgi:two-component system response regulator CpxR